jgi:putative component of membrane protein insertase Oxa1/YidC/SpoIIIJ protein YidD
MHIISKILILTSILSLNALSQTDWQKWDAKGISYPMSTIKKINYSFDKSSMSSFILSSARNIYKFFISDLDGDNCPFHPTCSSFLLLAVKETNILQGSLMFADRFTRDLNLIKVKGFYPLTKDYHFYDPACNYTLHPDRIKIIPISEVVNE